MARPDIHDITIMMGVNNRDTIPEMSQTTGLGLATVHKRLGELQTLAYVDPPRKPHAARDYTLTESGRQYLLVNGYLPPVNVFEP